MAPSHYLEQCGLLIKLINKVPWHLYQWIIIKDLNIPISKMRLKLVLWDNFTSSPKIIHFISFSSDNSFVLCYGGKLIFIVTIFNPSYCCLLKGNKVPSPCVFCDHTTRGQYSKNLKQTCCMGSQSHGTLTMRLLWPHYKGAIFQELKTNLLHGESVTWKIMTSVKAKIRKLLVN